MNCVKTAMLLAVLTATLVFLGSMIGGRQGAVFAVVMAGFMNFFSYWFSDKIILKMYRAKPVIHRSSPH